MAALLVVLGALATVVLGTILNGWVLQILWSWFIVPVFSLPVLGVAQAIGIAGVVGYLTKDHDHDHDERSPGDKIATALLTPPVVLGFGWIVKQFL